MYHRLLDIFYNENHVFIGIYSFQAKMTVSRSDPLPITEMDIEITKKAGKDIGFNFIECQEQGILVTEIVNRFEQIDSHILYLIDKKCLFYFQIAGSPTALDNRLQIGDMITSINGDSVRNANIIDCVLLIKSSQNRIILKVSRPTVKK